DTRGALVAELPEERPLQAMEAIFRERDLAWQNDVVEALSQSPWMKERGLAVETRSPKSQSIRRSRWSFNRRSAAGPLDHTSLMTLGSHKGSRTRQGQLRTRASSGRTAIAAMAGARTRAGTTSRRARAS